MSQQECAQLALSGIVARYKSAYRVAKWVMHIGRIVQILGICIGLASAALGCLGAQGSIYQSTRPPAQNVFMAASIIAGLCLIALSWIIATLIWAHGQTLRAALDCAVHSSPFLSNHDKALAMGLS
jgi:tellurite resistance protein TehA-like permease